MTPTTRYDDVIETEFPFLSGGSEMAERIRRHDWRDTPFGPLSSWPDSLRVTLGICLNSAFPMAIYWGPELRLLYNDAWAAIPGPRHPWALGRPAREVWSDIWHVLEGQFAEVLAGRGFATYDQPLPMQRYGAIEETFWNYSFTPIRGEQGRVVGVLNSGNETTRTVLTERRLKLLVDLGDRLRDLGDPFDIMRTSSGVVGEHLGASRCGYAEFDEAARAVHIGPDWSAEGVASLAGRLELEAFGAEFLSRLARGEIVAVHDVAQDPLTAPANEAFAGIDVRSFVVAPIVRNGRLHAAFFVHDRAARHWADSETRLVEEAAGRTWNAVELARAKVARRESERRFRNMADNAPLMMWVTDPTGYCTYLNSRWYEFTGQTPEEAVGFGWLEATHPDDRAEAERLFIEANAAQEGFEVEYRLRRHDGAYRWAIDAASPRLDENGAFLGYVGSVIDITERKLAEERKVLMINELHHRVKNSLATVDSVINATLRTSPSIEEFREGIRGRIASLSRSHTLLAADSWVGAELEPLLRMELEPYDDFGRVELAGPDVHLPSGIATSVAMAVHELATNAVKHGSLSVPEGRVRIAWTTEPSEKGTSLVLHWTESGGPPVSPPTRKGFGSTLLERLLARQLEGTVEVAYPPEGARVRIEAEIPAPREIDPGKA